MLVSSVEFNISTIIDIQLHDPFTQWILARSCRARLLWRS